ncbi:uracil-DNA glycosylase-like protein [Choanephora cucurbitarum]|nr:uracil-DNA glycosylase-like protein [Choanephora cucurbitarum]
MQATNIIHDLIQPDTTSILFVGINPSARETDPTRQGHFFSASRNRFFQYLSQTGLIRATDNQDTLVFQNYNISFTNYVQQPTHRERDITNAMMVAGRDRLTRLINRHTIQSICFVGVKCANHFMHRHRSGYGLVGEYPLQDGRSIPVYCVPSGSGRVRMTAEAIQHTWDQTINELLKRVNVVQILD